MAYSQALLDCIISFLDEDDWNYQVNREREFIRAGLTIEGKMRKVEITIDYREDEFLVYFTCPFSVEEAERAEMRDLLNRINYGLMFGCFELDERDGEIRFRVAVDCEDQLPSPAIIRNSIYRSAMTVNKYGNAIVQVLMGFATGKDAYEAAQKSND